MPDIRDDVKSELRLCARTIADLSRETGIPYRRLSGALNGYWYLQPEEDSRIRGILTKWRRETVETLTAGGANG